MSGTIEWCGEDLVDYGLRIGSVQTYDSPGHSGQSVLVPGRLGEAPTVNDYLDTPNEIREYDAAVYLRNASNEAVAQKMAELRSLLMNDGKYYIFRDSYEPSFYRLAFWYGSFAPQRKGAGNNFRLPLRWSCDPRRFVYGVSPVVMTKSGATTAQITASVTGYAVQSTANPVIKVEGGNQAFTLKFGKLSSLADYGEISFAAFNRTVWFDVDTLSASYDEEGRYNANSEILDVTGNVYLLAAGTIFTRSNASAKITITPRWWVR